MSALAWLRPDFAIYLTFLGVMAIMLVPRAQLAWIRGIALATAVGGFVIALITLLSYQPADPMGGDAFVASFRQYRVQFDWVRSLGISYHLGADGVSLPLVVLNGVVAVCGVLFSWNLNERAKEFFAFFLALIGGVYGVFLSLDLFLLFLFYELAIIPKYFVIAIWGSKHPAGTKEYAGMKLVLYSFIGSAFVLVGILAMVVVSPEHSFDLFSLRQVTFTEDFQFWCFPFVFFGFAVLAGVFPFHTWAPVGHSAAPTAASMLLAGVVMKLGAYGCLRVAMLLLPAGLTTHGAFWQTTIGVLSVIGIVYGAGVALVQNDFKFVIGYSSVSHMGFVLLGLVSLNSIGMSGAVLQMFSHGIVASLLFAVVGRMVYERAHTRELDELSAMQLARQMPFVAVVFIIGGLASMGLPGFSGFVAELMILIGSWQQMPLLTVIAGAGIVITVWYTLRTVLTAFFGEKRPFSPAADHAFDAITWPEKVGSVFLIFWLVLVGLYPAVLLDPISKGMELMLPTLKGVG